MPAPSDYSDTNARSSSRTSQVSANSASTSGSILLATARVIIEDGKGHNVFVRALIDPGSQRCFITESVIAELSPNRRPASCSIIGVGGAVTSRVKKEVDISIGSIGGRISLKVSALVLGSLTKQLPAERVNRHDWPHIEGLKLVDPQFSQPGKIDCIIGADLYPLIIANGVVNGPACTPVAQDTIFGWILTGETSGKAPSPQSEIRAHLADVEPTLSEQLSKFWEI